VWSKQTNFELATRVPLLIRAAGQTQRRDIEALVESVDLYPTLAALAGLPPPPDLDGTDLTPLMTGEANAKAVDAAFSEFPRCAGPTAPWCVFFPPKQEAAIAIAKESHGLYHCP